MYAKNPEEARAALSECQQRLVKYGTFQTGFDSSQVIYFWVRPPNTWHLCFRQIMQAIDFLRQNLIEEESSTENLQSANNQDDRSAESAKPSIYSISTNMWMIT